MSKPVLPPMTTNPDLRAAAAADLAGVQALLKAAGLPFEDLDAGMLEDFVVLRDGDNGLLAAGGIERYGESALLRSVVVRADAHGRGLGRTVVVALERHARVRGVRTLYLLTTTAAEFFPRLGYETFDRDAVPPAVAQSTEFAAICPASAVCMMRNLE